MAAQGYYGADSAPGQSSTIGSGMREPSPQSDRVVRASELAQYGYCARAWWLSVIRGAPSANAREMSLGDQVHRRHGRSVWLARALVWAAAGLVVLAALIVIL